MKSDQVCPELELTIVMPCLNESETLATCIEKANAYLERSSVAGEVVVADNGSTDGSQGIAILHGARVVDVSLRGYGAALMAGINAAKGTYVIMGDSDDSYDFDALDGFVEKLREGYQLVMGNRFQGGIAPGAMPPLHRYLGNPVLSFLGRLFYTSEIGDFHCGLRGFDRQSILSIDLRTTGMEFASEMVVKAGLHDLRIAEIPTTLSPDGRSGAPHLNSWRDGWRHLRFLLMFSPRWLFLYPGIFLTAFGLFAMFIVLFGTFTVGNISLDVHTMLIGSASTLVGTEIIIFFWLTKQHAMNMKIVPIGERFRNYRRRFSLEATVLGGSILTIAGILGVCIAVLIWAKSGFGELDISIVMRIVISSVTMIAVGVLVILGAFMSGILDLQLRTG